MTPDVPSLLTSVLALAAAAQFATGTLMARRGLGQGDSVTGAVISIGTSALIYWAVAPLAIAPAYFLSPAVWVFAGIGVLRPGVTTILAYEGNRRVGPTIAATMASLSPMFAVAGGVVFLAERPAATTLLGTLGVVCGAAVLAGKGRVPRSWPVWALLFPLGAAMIRSGAHVAARWGLLMLPSVVMSGLVAYSVSFTVSASIWAVRHRRARQPLTRAAFAWFVGAGALNAGAIFALNTALMLGQVVVVSPLTATYPVFTLLGSWLVFRQEQITGRTVAGVLLIVPSVILITLGR